MIKVQPGDGIAIALRMISTCEGKKVTIGSIIIALTSPVSEGRCVTAMTKSLVPVTSG